MARLGSWKDPNAQHGVGRPPTRNDWEQPLGFPEEGEVDPPDSFLACCKCTAFIEGGDAGALV